VQDIRVMQQGAKELQVLVVADLFVIRHKAFDESSGHACCGFYSGSFRLVISDFCFPENSSLSIILSLTGKRSLSV
jgi:hypothetical protein